MRSTATKAPVGLWLARGSQRLGMSNVVAVSYNPYEESKEHGRPQAAKKSPVGSFLVPRVAAPSIRACLGRLAFLRIVSCAERIRIGDRLCGFYEVVLRRVCSLLRAKREPERTAVPVGNESPSGAFKAQTGLRSKCCVLSTARSPLLSKRGRWRVAAPCVCFVPWTALAFCRPLLQQLLPISATGRGRRRCKLRATRP